ncbi:hypothetical protein F4S46_09755 [Salmonella enterica subsp. enterica serovar Reading]|nr:hypothetical protein [Salmonella enterica subsp. enterica serovar Reading]
MKVSSSRMKNKVGAQKGAFIKMKQENIYIYQRECAECYVPIISKVVTNFSFITIFSFSFSRTCFAWYRCL